MEVIIRKVLCTAVAILSIWLPSPRDSENIDYTRIAICVEQSDGAATFEDMAGNLWGVYGKFETGKQYSLIMNNNGTIEDITDDIVKGVES